MVTRERLLDAAEQIIRERGIMAVTTKDLARETGLAEGTLYRHFRDKTELLLAVFGERLSGHFLRLIRELPGRAGEASVRANLEELATAATDFFGHTAPISVAVAADPALARRHYARLRELGAGPEVASVAIAAYIQGEQRLGRVRAEIDPAAVATLLLSTCFNYTYARHVTGAASAILPPERFSAEIVRTLLLGLEPPG